MRPNYKDPAILATLKDIENDRIPLCVRNLKPGQAVMGPSGALRVTRIKDGIMVDRLFHIARKTAMPGVGHMTLVSEEVLSHFLPVANSKFMDITEVPL